MNEEKKNKILKIIDIIAVVICGGLFIAYFAVDHESNVNEIIGCVLSGLIGIYFVGTYFLRKSVFLLIYGIYNLAQLFIKIIF